MSKRIQSFWRLTRMHTHHSCPSMYMLGVGSGDTTAVVGEVQMRWGGRGAGAGLKVRKREATATTGRVGSGKPHLPAMSFKSWGSSCMSGAAMISAPAPRGLRGISTDGARGDVAILTRKKGQNFPSPQKKNSCLHMVDGSNHHADDRRWHGGGYLYFHGLGAG